MPSVLNLIYILVSCHLKAHYAKVSQRQSQCNIDLVTYHATIKPILSGVLTDREFSERMLQHGKEKQHNTH